MIVSVTEAAPLAAVRRRTYGTGALATVGVNLGVAALGPGSKVVAAPWPGRETTVHAYVRPLFEGTLSGS